MGVRNSVEIVANIPAEEAYNFLKEIGRDVKKYKLIDDTPTTIIWRKGQGWTSSIRVRADLKALSDNETRVIFTAEIATFFDPYNFTMKAIDLFDIPFRQKIGNLKLNKPTNSERSRNQISVADEIKKLAELKEAGILSEEEFKSQKQRILLS